LRQWGLLSETGSIHFLRSRIFWQVTVETDYAMVLHASGRGAMAKLRHFEFALKRVTIAEFFEILVSVEALFIPNSIQKAVLVRGFRRSCVPKQLVWTWRSLY
jgi:hypothetical protein